MIIKSHDFKGIAPPILSENKGYWLPRITTTDSYNSFTQELVLTKTITETESQWVYAAVDLSTGVIAAKQAVIDNAASVAAAIMNISNDDLVTYLQDHTLEEIDVYVSTQFSVLATMLPDDIDIYLDANVTDLPSVVDVLKVLAKDLAATMVLLKITTKMAAFAAKKEL
jgi:hypothetical protein